MYDQEILDCKKGDCLRASLATMMQVPPSEITNYSEVEMWATTLYHEWEERGYYMYWETLDKLSRNESPTGYMIASVPSKMCKGVCHAVVIDSEFNLVHDPNPVHRRDSVDKSEIVCLLVAVKKVEEVD